MPRLLRIAPFPNAVTDLLRDNERLLKVTARLAFLTQAVSQIAQVVESGPLHRPIADPTMNYERLLVVVGACSGCPKLRVNVPKLLRVVPSPARSPTSRVITK
jgi:hypothetical protein